MRVPLASMILLAGLLLAPSLSAAPGAPSNFETHPTAVYAQLGLGTPLGWGGVELEHSLAPFVAISGGVGMGFAGPQVAVMPRLRFGGRHSAGTLGVGVSRGNYRWEDTCSLHCGPTAPYEGTVLWGNLEGGYEYRGATGFTFRAFVGAGKMMWDDLTCRGTEALPCSSYFDKTRLGGYTGAALGYAF